MRNLCAIALILAAALSGTVARGEVLVFKGDAAPDAGITIGGWGSGAALESSERVYVGSRSVKITTEGLHEGGSIAFKNPIELLADPVDDNDYLQFVLAFTTIVRGPGMGSSGPGFGATSVPGLPTPGSYYYHEFEIPSRPKVNTIRVVMESVDGRGVEATVDVPGSEEAGWYKISVPFKVLGFKQGESFRVSRICIFSDVADTFYLGEIGTVRDSTPITAQAGDDQVVAVYDTVTFPGEAEGGASMLRYSWNFGDRDPDGEDATGQLVTHKYTKGGDFTVKLTVSDVWGIKKPAVATVAVSVND